MARISLKQHPGTEIEIRRSSRARRMSLRVSSLDGRVTLTLPPRVGTREAQKFAESKAGWIAQALEGLHRPVQVAIGTRLPVDGTERSIIAGQGRSARLLRASISAPEDRTGVVVLALLKALARDRLTEAVDLYADRLGREAGRLTLRDTRSRWGSCTHEGNLMFSWRLILAPPEVLGYVAAHEVAHLEHMDHSPDFWRVVGEISPGYEPWRAWLRREGPGLHRYRFDGD